MDGKERIRIRTEKGRSYDLEQSVKALRCALRSDDLTALELHLDRLLDIVSEDAPSKNIIDLIDNAKNRVLEITGKPYEKIPSHQISMPRPSPVPTPFLSSANKVEIDAMSSINSSTSNNSQKSAAAELCKARIRKRILAEQKKEELRALRAEQIAKEIALESKFKVQELHEESVIKVNEINLQVDNEQFLGSDEESSGRKESEPEKMRETLSATCGEADSMYKLNQSQAQVTEHALAKAIDRLNIATTETIPKFAGSIKDRHTFIMFTLKFEANYGKRIGYTDYEKLLKLSELTVGDAKMLVDSCFLLGDYGYTRAREKLMERFGDPREITTSLIKNLTQGASLELGDNHGLVKFYDELDTCVDTLLKLNKDYGDKNSVDYIKMAETTESLSILIKKLPIQWRNPIISQYGHPTLNDIRQFLKKKTKNLTSHLALACAKSPKFQYSKITMATTVTACKGTCKFCENDHLLIKCPIFLKKIGANEKRNFLRKYNLCFNCHESDHVASDCKSESNCRVESCKWKLKHSPFLHNVRPKESPKPIMCTDKEMNDASLQTNEQFVETLSSQKCEIVDSEPESDIETAEKDVAQSIYCTDIESHTAKNVLLPVLPVIVRSGISGKSVQTFACLDSMSSLHCANDVLLNTLCLDLPCTKTVVSTVGGKKELNSKITSLYVKGLRDADSSGIYLDSVEFLEGAPLSKIPIPSRSVIESFPHLSSLSDITKPLELNQVSLIIGAEKGELFIPQDLRVGKPDDPIAMHTKLGWMVMGGARVGDSSSTCFYTQRTPSDDIENDLRQLWDTESDQIFSQKKGLSEEDRKALGMMTDSICLNQNGSYQLPMLFRKEPNFPDNRGIAEKMLKHQIPRFLRDENYLRMYTEQVEKYIANGHARIVDMSSETAEPGMVWRIVHHGVKSSKKPDQIRVVFNCSHQHKGVSLNQQLYPGPDFINLLVGVLIRFRLGKHAISADIKSMYHCVAIPSEQRKYLRWLWFRDSDPRNDIIELEMLVHVFGCLSSSACANFALRHTTQHLSELSPERFEVCNNFYVDDYLSSFDDPITARATVSAVFELLRKKNFILTKFSATSDDLLKDIPPEHVANSRNISKTIRFKESDESSTQATLGILWNKESDTLIYKPMSLDIVCSKRGVLSALSKIIYDPCGLVSPVLVLPARVLFQDLCSRKVPWDEPLEPVEEQRFRKWYANIIELGVIEIPRCVRPKNFGTIVQRELHFLSDASEKAFGSCAYIREISENGLVSCNLVFAKSRLTPLKRNLTLVKLELQGAAMSAANCTLVTGELKVKIDQVHFWIDSLPVLGYINNSKKRYQVFTANRLSIIRGISDPDQWHWIDSSQNSSDLVTRGVRKESELKLWLSGPEFLKQPSINYETLPAGAKVVKDGDPELRKCQTNFTIAPETPQTFTQEFLVKFNNIYRMKVAAAVLIKFFNYTILNIKPTAIDIADLKVAEFAVIRVAQKEAFGEEIVHLQKGESLGKTSCIRKLAPFLDSHGLLRVGGRISDMQVAYDFRFPIILPKGHHLTHVYIREYHQFTGHGSVQHILNEMRHRFHVIGGKSTVHSIWVKCIPCRRYIAQPDQQLMADLPVSRLKVCQPPFSYTTLDLFGHFFVKIGRSAVKRWGVMFVCQVSKAVHLEIVHTLNVSSFMDALRRMYLRHIRPVQIRSDQGSNLRAADSELRAAVEIWNSNGEIAHLLKQKNIDWVYSPATASNMNGLAERMIRSAREVLVHLLNEQILKTNVSDESLATIFVECEAILNSRPIAAFSNNASDGRALTPGHMLRPMAHVSEVDLPPGIFTENDIYCRRHWRQTQYILDVFWRRFMKEVIPTMQKRQKWLKPKVNMKIGDLVLILDENTHRGEWRYGRVDTVKTSKDEKVRSCIVKTSSGGYLERPVNKLCILESCMNKG